MDITAFIRELLFGHECVIVPGFGGFIGNYTPARIDKSTSTFYPPVKQISFNRNLNNNDGLLIGRISDSAKISYNDAKNLVDEFVNDICKRLSGDERVILDNIGSFVNNKEGNVQFEPDKEANYHLDSYGLTTFQFPPLEGYDLRKRILKYGEKEPGKHPSFRKILWRAAVVIPLLTIMIAVSLKTDIFKSKVQTTNLNPLANVEFENNRQALEKNQTTDGLLITGQPNQAKNSISNEVPVILKEEKTLPAENINEVYCLITGSFKLQGNAVSLMKKLTGEGYKPELMDGPNGFYRVSAMRCSSLDEAVNMRDSIGKKYTGTWITKIR